MEDSDTLLDIVLNRPVGTSTPTHTSEALLPIDFASPSPKQRQAETDNPLPHEPMDLHTSIGHDNNTEEPSLLPGVTNDNEVNKQPAEVRH